MQIFFLFEQWCNNLTPSGHLLHVQSHNSKRLKWDKQCREGERENWLTRNSVCRDATHTQTHSSSGGKRPGSHGLRADGHGSMQIWLCGSLGLLFPSQSTTVLLVFFFYGKEVFVFCHQDKTTSVKCALLLLLSLDLLENV